MTKEYKQRKSELKNVDVLSQTGAESKQHNLLIQEQTCTNL